jgi:capsular exopolysaccharide synthesis family protein
MTFLEFANLLKQNLFKVIAMTAIGGAFGFAWALAQPSLYTSTASAIVATGPAQSVGTAAVASRFAADRIKSYEPLVKSRSVAVFVTKKLRLNVSPSELAKQVSGYVALDSAVLEISATAESPRMAARLAEAWVQGMTVAVDKLESVGSIGGETQSIVRLVSFDSATIPDSPSSPDYERAFLYGLTAGFAIGVSFLVLRVRLDSRVRNAKQISDLYEISVIGELPFNQTLHKRAKEANIDDLRSPARKRDSRDNRVLAEAIKKLRTNLSYINVDRPPKRIVVTSALPDEGKSTVTLFLANAIAESGKTVIVVDADLRLRSLAKAFGVLEAPGLTDVLVQTVQVEDVLQPVGTTGRLFVLAAGAVPPNPSELLASDAFSALLDKLTARGLVLIDAPPLIPVTDAAIAAAKADGALLIIRADKTKLPQVEQALASVSRVNGKVLGVVLNGLSKKSTGRKDAYYSAYYGEDNALKKIRKTTRA